MTFVTIWNRIAESASSSDLGVLAHIRIHGVRGYHSLEIGETQLNGGVIGIMSNNQVVYITPGLSRWAMRLHVRLFNDEYKGLLCPLHTSMGPSAGSTRMVVNMIKVRVMREPALAFLERPAVIVREEEDRRIREKVEEEGGVEHAIQVVAEHCACHGQIGPGLTIDGTGHAFHHAEQLLDGHGKVHRRLIAAQDGQLQPYIDVVVLVDVVTDQEQGTVFDHSSKQLHTYLRGRRVVCAARVRAGSGRSDEREAAAAHRTGNQHLTPLRSHDFLVERHLEVNGTRGAIVPK